MAIAMSTASSLPTIKCSNCAVDVILSMLGDHICSTAPQPNRLLQNATNNSDFGKGPRMANNKKIPFSRPGPPLRVDSSVANRSFLPPHELTPAGSDTVSPGTRLYDIQLPSFLTQNPPAVRVTQGPPSPEYSNLDCAFPPFPSPLALNAPHYQEAKAVGSRIEDGYLNEHAQPTKHSPQASQSSSAPKRSRSVTSVKAQGASGTLEGISGHINRPSTANGEGKPTLASISGGSKAAVCKQPPLPSGISKSTTALATPTSRHAGYVGIWPENARPEALVEQAKQQRPLLGNRTGTFPMQNGAKISGNSPYSLSYRRHLQASSIVPAQKPQPQPQPQPHARDTTSLQSPQDPGFALPRDLSLGQSLPSQEPVCVKHPSAASRNNTRKLPGNCPIPVRDASPPYNRPPLATQTISTDSGFTNESFTSHDSVSSNTSSSFLAQSISSRSSTSPANKIPAGKPLGSRDGGGASDFLLLDPALPPPMSFNPPESPTDPLCLQGRLSPIPHGVVNRPLFSASSPSSASSPRPFRLGPSQEVHNRRGELVGNRGACRGCSRPILAGQRSISSKDGRLTGRYHKQCFACHTCHGRFETADFYVHDDHPFCAEHYHALNGSLCNGCGKGIEGQYLEVTNQKDKPAEKFHPKCLICSSCHIGLQDDYYEWMGKIYCERDAKRAADARKQPRSDASVLARPNNAQGSRSPNHASAPGRSGLPAGPRHGLRPLRPGHLPWPENGFSFPLPRNEVPIKPSSGERFPERRTTKLMMM